MSPTTVRSRLPWAVAGALTSVAIPCCIALGALWIRPAIAAHREPLCGPTRTWTCTLRNGDTTTQIGTICEIQKYEKKKHATCEPATQ